jgi:uncharacterized membrane protein YhaH (DUF805 family)
MSFTQAISSGLSKYAVFEGRAMRSEYWFWVLFVILVSIGTNIIDAMLNTSGIVGLLVSLALFIPNIAVGARRLHDIGKSGWNQLWGLIPLFGWIYVIYLYVQPSVLGTNQYGPQPSANAGMQPAG